MRAALAAPDLSVERTLGQGGVVIGLDEVGRGAIAGPVCVGAVAVHGELAEPPPGLRDSKVLSANRREVLVPLIQAWALGSAVGEASAEEIDELGIMAALRLAALRAIQVLGVPAEVALLDGAHDWLSPLDETTVVHTKVKADQSCASVAAASIVAKVYRDGLMRQLHRGFPQYGWDSNKGYASAAHAQALASSGVCVYHRRTWRLPGVSR